MKDGEHNIHLNFIKDNERSSNSGDSSVLCMKIK